MMEELVSYIKKNLKKGYTSESLKWALVNQGYSKMEIEKAFKRLNQQLSQQAPKLPPKTQITHEIIEPKELASSTTHTFSNKKPFWKKWFGL